MYMMDVNLAFCGDHFAMYINIKSVCCIPETNNVVCQLYLNEKIKTIENLLDGAGSDSQSNNCNSSCPLSFELV